MSEDWADLLDSCEELEETGMEGADADVLATAVGAIEEEEEEEEEELEYGYSYSEDYSYDYAEEGDAYEADWGVICEEFGIPQEGSQVAYLADILLGSPGALFSAIRADHQEPPRPSGLPALALLQTIAAADDERQERLVDILCVVGGASEGDEEFVSPETGLPLQFSALQVAAAQGSVEWAQLFVDAYLKTSEAAELLNYQSPGSFYSALHLAAKRDGDRSEIVQLLLDAGASAELVDVEYRTPLHLAAMAGNADCVETLLSSETSLAQIMTKDSAGLTPLHHAAFGQFETLTIITEWIETVCSSDESLEYAKVLEEMTDEQGRTALHAAACSCSIEILAVLLEGGMDVNGLDAEGRNVLHWAVSGGADSEGREALNKGELELCLTYCLTQGARLDVRDRRGRSPLHLAAYFKHRRAVEFFLTQHHRLATPAQSESSQESGAAAETAAETATEATVAGAETETKAENEAETEEKKETEERSTRGPEAEAETTAEGDGESVTNSAAEKSSETEAATAEAEAKSASAEPESERATATEGETEGSVRCLHVMDVDTLGRNVFHYSVALGADSLRVLLQAVAVDNGLGISLADLTVADHKGMTPLHIAAMKGHEEAVVVLMKKLAKAPALLRENVSAQDGRGRGVAFYAAHHGMEEAVARVFKAAGEEGASGLFAVDSMGKSLFHAAAAGGVGKVLVSLQEQCSEETFQEQAKGKDSRGRTPVHFASACGHEIAVRWFTAHTGADASLAPDEGGDVPAFHAAYFGQVHCVRELLNATDSKATLEHYNNDNQTIFHAAAAGGSAEALNLLLEVAQSLGLMEKLVSGEDAHGCTPLLLAAMGGFTYAADTLRHYGAHVGSKDGEGRTIFHFAISTGNAQLLFALLTEVSFDAELVNAQDTSGHTPLHYSAFTGDADCMSMLLSCSEVDPSIRDHTGRHALTVSASLGDDHLCNLLLGHAKVDALSQDNRGRTALDAAAFEGHQESVQELVAHLLAREPAGVDPALLVDKQGRTPLHAAAYAGRLEACLLLAEKLRLPVDGEDAFGRTPLHHAAAAGAVQCVMGLLELGADASKADKKGVRPVQLAEHYRHDEACAVLNAMA